MCKEGRLHPAVTNHNIPFDMGVNRVKSVMLGGGNVWRMTVRGTRAQVDAPSGPGESAAQVTG